MGAREIAPLRCSMISGTVSSTIICCSQFSGRLSSVPLMTRVASLRLILSTNGAPALSHLLSSTEPPRMSCELNVSNTSPGRIPAFAAGEAESTLVTTGYESKNALPRSSIIAWSEILTPNQPVGGCTITAGVRCAWPPKGSVSDAIKANASHDAFLDVEIFIPLTISLEPPQSNRTCDQLLRGHARTHRRQVVLVEHRIVRRRPQRAHRRVLDLVECRRSRRVHRHAVPAAHRRIIDGEEL